jgi:hypothetical protein
MAANPILAAGTLNINAMNVKRLAIQQHLGVQFRKNIALHDTNMWCSSHVLAYRCRQDHGLLQVHTLENAWTASSACGPDASQDAVLATYSAQVAYTRAVLQHQGPSSV